MSENMVERFWSKVDRRSDLDCWPWLAHGTTNTVGALYGRFRFGGKMRASHRVAWELTHGPIPAGLVIRHKCDFSRCCNPSHLELGTQKDNVRDRYERGRENHSKGSRHGNSKLSEDDIVLIRSRLRSGDTYKKIAKDFRISLYGVYYAKIGWAHVQ
jgi:hypothetical protein